MKTFIVALSALVFASCASSKNGTGSEAMLYEKEWKLTELNGTPVNTPRVPTIQFTKEGQRVSGFAGCNRMMGTFTITGEALKFSPLAATKMACMDENVETQYLQALTKVSAYSVKDGELSLTDGTAAVAKFK